MIGEPSDLLRSFPNPQFKLQATLGAGQPFRSWAGLGAGVGRVGEDAFPKSEIVLSLETSLENKELTFQSWFHQWRVGLADFWGSQGKRDFFSFFLVWGEGNLLEISSPLGALTHPSLGWTRSSGCHYTFARGTEE